MCEETIRTGCWNLSIFGTVRTVTADVTGLVAVVAQLVVGRAIPCHMSSHVTLVARHIGLVATTATWFPFCTIPCDVAWFPTCVASAFLWVLIAVSCDMSSAITPVTSVHFFFAVSGEMSRSVAFVALGIHPGTRTAVSFIATTTTVWAVSLHVTTFTTPIAHCTTHFGYVKSLIKLELLKVWNFHWKTDTPATRDTDERTTRSRCFDVYETNFPPTSGVPTSQCYQHKSHFSLDMKSRKQKITEKLIFFFVEIESFNF